MRIICVRQGETDASAGGLVQGHTDFSLNDHGRQQAQRLREFITTRELNIDAVYASDLSRAVETATISFPKCDVTLDERFREQDFGLVVGGLADYLDDHPEFRLTSEDASKRRFPEGESVHDVYERVTDGLDDLLATHEDDETVVVVCHFTPMLCLVSLALEEPLHETWASEHFENIETIVFDEQDGQLSVTDRHVVDA